MRAPTIAMVIAGLGLWGGQAVAQSLQPLQPSALQPSLPSPSQPPQPSRALPQPSLPSASASQPSPPSQSQLSQLSQSLSQPPLPPSPSRPSQSSPSQALAQPSPPRYSADGLYNLANSYARAGKPGLAVLNYERAALLAPNDADINANLEYVRAFARVPTEPRNRLSRIAQAANPTLAAWTGVLGIALAGAGLLGRRITRRFRWMTTGGTLLGVALIALTVPNAMLLWPRMHDAVVLINQTPARVSPVPMGDTAFVLREAETVTMTAEHENFILIRTRSGSSGWVARANVGAVVP